MARTWVVSPKKHSVLEGSSKKNSIFGEGWSVHILRNETGRLQAKEESWGGELMKSPQRAEHGGGGDILGEDKYRNEV